MVVQYKEDQGQIILNAPERNMSLTIYIDLFKDKCSFLWFNKTSVWPSFSKQCKKKIYTYIYIYHSDMWQPLFSLWCERQRLTAAICCCLILNDFIITILYQLCCELSHVFCEQGATEQLDLDDGGQSQALGRFRGDVLTAQLVPVQTQRPQFGEIHHVHNGTETSQGELCSRGTKWEVLTRGGEKKGRTTGWTHITHNLFTFDLIGLQIQMLQSGADRRDSLQLVEAQVQLHQPGHVEGVGRDALIGQQVVGHPHVLQLWEPTHEALWESVDGVGLQVELVQTFRQSLWDLGGREVKSVRVTMDFNGTYRQTNIDKQTNMFTFVSLFPLMSSSVSEVRAFRDVPMSETALSWRYRMVRLSIPSRSADVT